MTNERPKGWDTWYPRSRDVILFTVGIGIILNEVVTSKNLTMMLFGAGIAAAPVPLRLDAGHRS